MVFPAINCTSNNFVQEPSQTHVVTPAPFKKFNFLESGIDAGSSVTNGLKQKIVLYALFGN
jgi:uncharacterized Zn-finger protein